MNQYLPNKSGLFVPAIRDIHLLIDDGGDSELDFLGFTIVLLDEFAYRDLESKVATFCETEGVSVLHARDLRMIGGQVEDMAVYELLYRRLFQTAIHVMSRANYFRVFTFLTSQSLITSVFHAHVQAFEKSEKLPQGARLPDKYRELYSYVAFPTIELLKKVKVLDDDLRIYIHIDNKKNFQELAKETTSLQGSAAGALLPVSDSMCVILNSWKKVVLKMNARIRQIHIADSSSFPLIGVADAFSNFSLNFARLILKGHANCSDTQRLKHGVFRDVLTTMIGEPPSAAEATEASIRMGFKIDGGKIVPLTDRPISTLEIGHGL